MIVFIHLSQEAFARIVQLRVLGLFQPIDMPIDRAKPLPPPYTFPRANPCYMDGFEITNMNISVSGGQTGFVLNNTDLGGIVPAQAFFQANPLQFFPLQVDLSSTIHMISADAMTAAMVPQADGSYALPFRDPDLAIPLIHAMFQVFFTVGTDGVPVLNFALTGPPLGIPNNPLLLNLFKGLSKPFPVASAFKSFLEPGKTRVLNAGIALEGPNDDVVIRLEFEPVEHGAATDNRRLGEWSAFFNGQTASQLAGRDWAIELPTDAFVASVAASVDKVFGSGKMAKYITKTRPVWGVFNGGHPPAIQFYAEGTINSICGGEDVQGTVSPTIVLSVPKPNTLRASVSVGIDLDDWDAFKCTVLSILNPFSGIISTYDLGLPWYAEPLVHFAQTFGPIAWGLGGDDLLIGYILKQEQDDIEKQGGIKIVRTSDTTFYTEVPYSISTAFTQNWLVVEDLDSHGDHIVARGSFTAPDVKTTPRLRGELTAGFANWGAQDRCSGSPDVQTKALITLSVLENGAVTNKPTVPIQFGIDVQKDGSGNPVLGGQITWRIVDDPEGVYSGSNARHSAVPHWSGIPGTYDVDLYFSDPSDPFASRPYPFHVQFFTSYGVREFEIPAPPPVPPPPTTSQRAKQISDCYIFSTLLTMVKALQVLWLPYPQPDGASQHWQVVVDGLSAEERVSVWNAATGELLAESAATNAGRAEISLIVPQNVQMNTMQLTLNGARPLSPAEYEARVRELHDFKEPGRHPVRIRQTVLYPVATFPLKEPAERVLLQRGPERLSILAQDSTKTITIQILPGDPSRVVALGAHSDARELPVQLPSQLFRFLRAVRDGRYTVVIHMGEGQGDADAVAKYYLRPWYDRGAVAGRFFAQLAQDGLSVNLYYRGATRQAYPDLGRPDGETTRN